ncbi:hypothetical protein [Pantoea piersonii]|uniref:hypothetical protein n=1 Tax=Pantoea piersonii TaxID=2364647 RepID=UPI00289C0A5F|nr:hypothetical protein [Pantoea piersonii]
MKKLIIGSFLAMVLSGCASQPNINKNEKVGDLVFIYNQNHSELAKQEADVMCGGKSYRIGVIGHGYSGKPGAMRMPFACTQKKALEYGSFEAKEEARKAEVKKDMQRIADIPWGGKEASKFFMNETHLFMLLECGWAGSVGFSTGNKPLVMLGDSYYHADKSSFKDGEYSISFNGGSMLVAYNPQKVKGYISDRNSFTPCAAVRLGED